MPPLDIFQRLRAVADAHSLEFLLIGGHAVNAHGYARTTLDVDLLSNVRFGKPSFKLGAIGFCMRLKHFLNTIRPLYLRWIWTLCLWMTRRLENLPWKGRC